MQEFVANRISSGNRVFPDKVTITDIGVTLYSPGLFNGKEKTLMYHEIASVECDSPIVGFSTIKFRTFRDSIICKGFTKDQVNEMKRIVNHMIAQMNGYGGAPAQAVNSGGAVGFMPAVNQIADSRLERESRDREIRIESERVEMEKKKQKHERADKLRQEGRNFHAFVVEYDNAIISGLTVLGFLIFLIYIKNK